MNLLNAPSGSPPGMFVFIADIQGNCIYVNHGFSRTFSLYANDFKGKPATLTLYPDDLDDLKDAMRNCLAGPSDTTITIQLRHVNNPLRPRSFLIIDWTMELMPDQENQQSDCILFTGNLSNSREITGDLKTSYDLLHNLINNTPLAVIEYDRNMLVTKWNGQAEKIFGWTAQEAIGRPMNKDIVYISDWGIVNHVIAQLQGGADSLPPSENRNYTKDGSVIYCKWYSSAIRDKEGNITSYLSLVSDMSRQRFVEQNLSEREEQLRLFIEHSPAALAMFDTEMRYIVYSHRWLTDYNLGERDLTGKTHYEVFPTVPQHWKDIHQRCLRGAIEKNDEDLFEREDGSIDWVKWEVHPWYKGSGEIGGIIMFTEVITQQKEADIKFRHLAEKSLVGVYIIQKDRYVYVNPKFAEIFGYTQEELIDNAPVDIVVMEEDREKVLSNIRTRMVGDEDSMSYELRGRKKDGQMLWVEVFGNRTQYKGNPAIIGTLLDISARKRAEEEKDRIRYLLNERVKELTVLYRSHKILLEEHLSTKEILHEITSLLPTGWQYHEIAAARITFGDIECITPNYKPGPHRQYTEFETMNGIQGTIEVVYLENRPMETEDAFLTEERDLINTIAEMLRIHLDRKETTEALMKSEANLNTILETTDTAYILFDKDLKIISYNTRSVTFVRKMLTKAPDLNKSIFDYLFDEKRENLKKMLPQVLNGKTVSYESRYAQPDGTYQWYQIRIYPILTPEKEVLSLMMAITDITDQKRNERALLEHMKLMEELSFVTSHELRHEYARVQSAVNFLRDIKSSESEKDLVIKEIAKSLENINTLIYKLNDKLTFNQGGTGNQQTVSDFSRAEKILLIDDDPMINFLNERILNGVLRGSKAIENVTGVQEALEYLRTNDRTGNHLIFLDLNMPEQSGWDFLETYKGFAIQSPVMILTSSIDPGDMERAKNYKQVKKFLTKPLSIKFVKTLFTNPENT
jgi:PAS domain S-box-containing protein